MNDKLWKKFLVDQSKYIQNIRDWKFMYVWIQWATTDDSTGASLHYITSICEWQKSSTIASYTFKSAWIFLGNESNKNKVIFGIALNKSQLSSNQRMA